MLDSENDEMMRDGEFRGLVSPMMCITLGSFADDEFIRWVDWAKRFRSLILESPLSDAEKELVREVFNMDPEDVVGCDAE